MKTKELCTRSEQASVLPPWLPYAGLQQQLQNSKLLNSLTEEPIKVRVLAIPVNAKYVNRFDELGDLLVILVILVPVGEKFDGKPLLVGVPIGDHPNPVIKLRGARKTRDLYKVPNSASQ
jgi:hypothetical protein